MYLFVQIHTALSMAIGIISLSIPASDQPPKQYQYHYDQCTQCEHTGQVVGDVCFSIGFDVHEKRRASKLISISLWVGQVGGNDDFWVLLQFMEDVTIIHTASISCCGRTRLIVHVAGQIVGFLLDCEFKPSMFVINKVLMVIRLTQAQVVSVALLDSVTA